MAASRVSLDGMRLFRLLAAVALALGSVLAVATPAHAADVEIVRFDIKAVAERDGLVTVTQTMTYDFGSKGGRGPYLYLTTRQATDTPGKDRVYRYELVSVTSSTRAPTTVKEETLSGRIAWRIGDAGTTVYGRQVYTITYRVRGVVNPAVAQQAGGSLDEIYWNIIGRGWTVPISNVTVTLTGPAAVEAVTCYHGADYTEACDGATRSGTSATYRQSRLDPGQGLAVVGGWPTGTFQGAEPIYEVREVVTYPAFFNPTGTGVGAGVLAVGAGVLALLGRRRRDQQYVGVAPGLRPAADQDATVGPATPAPVAVQFTPPAGVAPGMVGTLVDERADNHDVTATIVDLAVRGFLRFEQGERKKDFTLVRLAASDGLLPYEARIFDKLFDQGDTVTRKQLKARYFGTQMARTRAELYDAVTRAGWFRGNPASVRTWWTVAGVSLVVAAPVVTVAATRWGLAPVGVALGVLGGATIVVGRWAPARTAEGYAVLAQARGFERYLATAEADQIRFEEGEDIFSRYLPYAIAFGCAERWAAVFQELADRGVELPQPSWYVGAGFYSGFVGDSFGSMLSSLDSFSETAARMQTSSSTGSSGGSGFSGGGFGGGVGGGGGGSW